MKLAERINRMATSSTFVMAAKAQELKAQGIDVISLSLGEPDFCTPEHIKRAAVEAIDNNFTYYAPVPGYMDLRKAVAAKLQRENGLEYQPTDILISTGGKQALCNVILSILDKDDECILPTPCWVSYSEMVKLAEAEPVFVPCGIEDGFKLTADRLRAAITPSTRAILLCSPSNPSGSVYSREELAALVAVLEEYPQIMIISDEIYEHINYVGTHNSIAQFPSVKDRVVIVNGVSKAYAMTGWRIGWAAAAPWVIKAAQKLQGQYTSCTCTIAMKAAQAAYEGPQDCVAEMLEAFCDYWAAPLQNPKPSQVKAGILLKYQTQETWSLAGRLRTWAKRDSTYLGYQGQYSRAPDGPRVNSRGETRMVESYRKANEAFKALLNPDNNQPDQQ